MRATQHKALAHGNTLLARLAVESGRMLSLVEEMGVQIERKQGDGVEGGGVSEGNMNDENIERNEQPSRISVVRIGKVIIHDGHIVGSLYGSARDVAAGAGAHVFQASRKAAKQRMSRRKKYCEMFLCAATHASFIADTQSRSCNVFSKRKVLPPPTKHASAESTALRGFEERCNDWHSKPIELKRSLALL